MEPDQMIRYREAMIESLVSDPGETVKGFVNGKPVPEGPVRIVVDFPDLATAVEWRRAEFVNGSLYRPDAIDDKIDNVFVVKNEGDRPDEFRLMLRTTFEEVA